MLTANIIIDQLGLMPHPEGGYFRETYRSDDLLNTDALPDRYKGGRSVATAIYYLIEEGNFSALHRVQSDEMFHFYLGSSVEVFIISPCGTAGTTLIGNDIAAGQHPQLLVPKGSIQGLRIVKGGAFALLGATVAPGFDFADFELMGRAPLIEAHPKWSEQITQLTRV